MATRTQKNSATKTSYHHIPKLIEQVRNGDLNSKPESVLTIRNILAKSKEPVELYYRLTLKSPSPYSSLPPSIDPSVPLTPELAAIAATLPPLPSSRSASPALSQQGATRGGAAKLNVGGGPGVGQSSSSGQGLNPVAVTNALNNVRLLPNPNTRLETPPPSFSSSVPSPSSISHTPPPPSSITTQSLISAGTTGNLLSRTSGTGTGTVESPQSVLSSPPPESERSSTPVVAPIVNTATTINTNNNARKPPTNLNIPKPITSQPPVTNNLSGSAIPNTGNVNANVNTNISGNANANPSGGSSTQQPYVNKSQAQLKAIKNWNQVEELSDAQRSHWFKLFAGGEEKWNQYIYMKKNPPEPNSNLSNTNNSNNNNNNASTNRPNPNPNNMTPANKPSESKPNSSNLAPRPPNIAPSTNLNTNTSINTTNANVAGNASFQSGSGILPNLAIPASAIKNVAPPSTSTSTGPNNLSQTNTSSNNSTTTTTTTNPPNPQALNIQQLARTLTPERITLFRNMTDVQASTLNPETRSHFDWLKRYDLQCLNAPVNGGVKSAIQVAEVIANAQAKNGNGNGNGGNGPTGNVNANANVNNNNNNVGSVTPRPPLQGNFTPQQQQHRPMMNNSNNTTNTPGQSPALNRNNITTEIQRIIQIEGYITEDRIKTLYRAANVPINAQTEINIRNYVAKQNGVAPRSIRDVMEERVGGLLKDANGGVAVTKEQEAFYMEAAEQLYKDSFSGACEIHQNLAKPTQGNSVLQLRDVALYMKQVHNTMIPGHDLDITFGNNSWRQRKIDQALSNSTIPPSRAKRLRDMERAKLKYAGKS